MLSKVKYFLLILNILLAFEIIFSYCAVIKIY